ncbi:MAG: superoxide dismutase [Thermodesulfobacteriota bacterium]|nr:superoxide dismutase [Thermodesulfobacteriota bacterium]
MSITLPSLPYDMDALAPHINKETLEFHYGKHHNAYVVNGNKLLEGTDLADKDLESVIKAAADDASLGGLFNNAAQVWNHSFYWNCMKPGGGGAPSGPIADKITSDFGTYETFVEQFKNAGATQFGSGWAWLILKDGRLEIMKTSNADTPIARGLKPLLTVDVWEHAYYLDYQNRRPDYLNAFVEHLINWDFVNAQMG